MFKSVTTQEERANQDNDSQLRAVAIAPLCPYASRKGPRLFGLEALHDRQ